MIQPTETNEASSTTSMPASLVALTSNLIDYAGLFPPAKLDMPTTVSNYSKYLACNESWMLGRLIVPAARLDEFEEYASELLPKSDESEPWRLSCLVAPAGVNQLDEHLSRIKVFNDIHADAEAGCALVDVLELRGETPENIETALDKIPDDLFAFFELPIANDPRGLLAALAGSDAGAKVRAGGLTPDDVPDVCDLARFIAACATANIPFKATAGLHHPLCNLDQAVGAKMYGFLNVFTAACLLREGKVDEQSIIELLQDESITAFTYSDDELAWRDNKITTEQITNARNQFAVSFGSCSFDEPRDDLRSLKLL